MAITPETDTTRTISGRWPHRATRSSRTTWTPCTEQTADTFEEDRVIIEAQWHNMQRFGQPPMVDIHVDAGANRARRVIALLNAANNAQNNAAGAPQ
jgi:hypothetical protein